MIKIEKCEVFGWEAAIRGCRNPMNSWDRSDSRYYTCLEANRKGGDTICNDCASIDSKKYYLGPNDHELMTKLRNAGTDHRKFMRMITMYCDITAPLYWWKEFDTYKVGTVANSCSTMHKIAAKKFELEDFSCEHLDHLSLELMETIICKLNANRHEYLEYKDGDDSINSKKDYWWQMIQLLPSSYNQKRTVMMNYEVLANIYKSRKGHKLDEWNKLCEWIEYLPYSEIITGKENADE